MRSFFRSPRFFLGLTLVLFFGFGLHHIGQFVTADEHYWVYERVPQYFEAWEKLKLKKTFINDKPGITLALVTGPALLWNKDTERHCRELKNRILECNTERTSFLFGSFRVLILLTNLLLLTLIFFLLSKLTNEWVAVWSISLIALSPITLGLSQIVNPDALLWSLGSAALFAWLALMKTGERQYAFLTLFLLGFSLLTKYVALILVPGFILASLLYFLLRREDLNENLAVLKLKQEILWLVVIVGGAITLMLVFLPALALERKYLAEFLMTVPDKERLVFWFSPLALWFFADLYLLRGYSLIRLRRSVQKCFAWTRVLSATFFLIFIGLVVARHAIPDWSIFSLIPFDLKDLSDARYYTSIPNFFETFTLEWNALVFTLTPIALLGLLFAWLHGLRRPYHDFFFFPFFLGIFSLLLMTILIRSNVLATPRYIILLYPLFAFIAGLGFWHVAQLFTRQGTASLGLAKKFPYGAKEQTFHFFKLTHLRNFLTLHLQKAFGRSGKFDDKPSGAGNNIKIAFSLLLLAGSIASLVSIRPFYFNYANFLLPKDALLADAWGYGGYEAAQYLNRLPDAESLTVWADYYGVCDFFVGRCLTAYTFDGNVIKPDFYVLTRRGEQRFMSRYKRWERLSGLTAHRYYRQSEISPVWSLEIDNRPGNFVKVFRVER